MTDGDRTRRGITRREGLLDRRVDAILGDRRGEVAHNPRTERRKVVRLPTGDELLVDLHRLVDPTASGVPDIGL
jgi:hypothetical protein